MKNYNKVYSVFGIFGIGIVLLTNSVFGVTGTVTGEKVRIREKASSNSSEISLATKGEKVDVIGEEGNWYKITFEKITGYISKDYVDTTYNSGNTESNSTSNSTQEEDKIENNSNVEEPVAPEVSQQDEQISTTPEPEIQQDTQMLESNSAVQNETNNNTQEEKKYYKGQTLSIEKEIDLKYVPNFSSRVVSSVASNSQLTVSMELGHWIKVSDGKSSGWVLKNNLADNSSSVNNSNTADNNTPEAYTSSNTSSNKTGIVNVDSARVRSTPDGNVIETLKEKDKVEIVGEKDDWYEINYGSTVHGFIAKRLITIE